MISHHNKSRSIHLRLGYLRLTLLIWAAVACFYTQPSKSAEQQKYLSSVSPEFPNGLHKKYLDYLAAHANISIEVNLLPFARRLASLKNSEIDIMVGLGERHRSSDHLIFLQPSYEKLTHKLFVLADSKPLMSAIDLQNTLVAITINGQYSDIIQNLPKNNVVQVTRLQQKIDLVRYQRVGAFVHFSESTLPMLKKMGLDKTIIEAEYQPIDFSAFYVAIGKQSKLLPHKEKLEEIIEQGVKQGDFMKIRMAHYGH